jgi:hypothetical protein
MNYGNFNKMSVLEHNSASSPAVSVAKFQYMPKQQLGTGKGEPGEGARR